MAAQPDIAAAEKGEGFVPTTIHNESVRGAVTSTGGESSDEKPPIKSGLDSDGDAVSVQRGLEPPEFIKGLTAEEREELEKKLKRKIDTRLLPAIIVMYILNYIDR